jgi:DNA modification methylase
VIKPSGSIFVNLGDKYSGSGGYNNSNIGANGRGPKSYNKSKIVDHDEIGQRREAQRIVGGREMFGDMPRKSLMGLPWRYAIGCIDQLGLTLRAEIIWNKPNGLPESVKDRVRRNHEQWFHFAKSDHYFAAIDEVREAYTAAPFKGQKKHNAAAEGQTVNPVLKTLTEWDATDYEGNPLGKLPGSVWTIPTSPLTVPAHLPQHFAAFPPEWPRRLIQGWSPDGICVVCDQGRFPVVEKTTKATIIGYACACTRRDDDGEYLLDGWDAPSTRPAVVLDPFGGTGTAAMVAHALGRIGISVDLSHDYGRLARWRCGESGHALKVLEKAQAEAQQSLF